ncbi:DUF6515 family protein [uncultured Winogradskyella sp.]|jgi:hypothetical protein|uniref:DUF6515 family protein n=1 Tax=uncultured Winogradskyella sp. TaxID=395353 RepID=UPI0025FC0E9F|nr:DUF6515 family protein [uncultured Winogradskyella sp.]
MKNLLILLGLIFFLSLNSCARRVILRQPANVTVVNKLPRNHKVVRINGKRYYVWNGKRYSKTKNGYVIVNI